MFHDLSKFFIKFAGRGQIKISFFWLAQKQYLINSNSAIIKHHGIQTASI